MHKLRGKIGEFVYAGREGEDVSAMIGRGASGMKRCTKSKKITVGFLLAINESKVSAS